jgi:hypothetical protein
MEMRLLYFIHAIVHLKNIYMNSTLTYSSSIEGWPSFYSYIPDWIIGMNNFLYTFKGGDLYKHNVNNARNTFYEQWWTKVGSAQEAYKPSTITSVFNDAILENKIFKTIHLEGDATWSATLQTDIQSSGFIEAPWFEKKEATYFAFVRNNSTGQYSQRSLNGIGRSYEVDTNFPFATIKFSTSPLISIGSIVSVGDSFYFSLPPYQDLSFGGIITDINIDIPNGINEVVINQGVPGTVFPIPIQDAYYLYIKNSVAESHGVLGHYCVFNITNNLSSKVELFAVGSDIMKSFP